MLLEYCDVYREQEGKIGGYAYADRVWGEGTGRQMLSYRE